MFRRIFSGIILLLAISSVFATKVGYAFSGGGARGFAHIGILKVMEEVGIRPQYISGTSIGALVGGLYAMGYNATEIESVFISRNWTEYFSDDWNRQELYVGQKRWAPYGNVFFRIDDNWKPQLPQSVIVGNKINLELFRIFASASDIDDFKDLPISFSCVATDLVSGELTIFDRGSLMQGIRASMSIPSILQPFPLNNTLYIDGGVSQNLPGKQVRDMGADFVIGFKANSGLRSKDRLSGLIHVLDQTINIGINNNLNEQLDYCSFILEPELMEYSATSFSSVKAIIDAGETYAREHLEELRQLANRLYSEDNADSVQRKIQDQQTFRIRSISVKGSNHLHSTKVKEYSGLVSGSDYSPEDIIIGMNNAWNSQLFDFVYPVLKKEDNDYLLEIHVQERERKYLAVNLTYDRENEFSAGLVLSLHNYLTKNSRLLAELKLGGLNELNVDMVKNFGDTYGVYYRIFPYIEEKRIYFYQDHNKVTSARSLEYGLTSGIGLFASKMIVLEGYGFSYKTILYREVAISDTLEKSVNISGIGIKAYHESLDDYSFPLSGLKATFKTSFASKDVLSDVTVNRCELGCIAYKPLSSGLSAIGGFQFGSHFKTSNSHSFDPFHLGGLDKFAGYAYYQKSAPYYRIVQAGAVITPKKDYYLTAKVQALMYNDSENWFTDNNYAAGGLLELGYQSYLAPVKIAVAINDDGNLQYYLALGYTGDIFHFSRR